MLAPRDLLCRVLLLSMATLCPSVMAQPPSDAPSAPDEPVAASSDSTEPSAQPPPLSSPYSSDQVQRLVHPEVATELGLDDQQRAKIQTLLAERIEISAAPDAADKKDRLIAIDEQIRGTLHADQLQKWKEDGLTHNLRFQFREQPWGEVLQWFARQQGLTLVMNQVPPGTFSYTDTRSYSASEAIDLLNSVLLTRGFTLVRREKMLTVLQLSKSIPIDLIPRVPLDQLASRGRFELVSVLFPLGKRPVDQVMKEVQPYLGSFGRAIPLPQSKQLLVVETAGKMETINVLINTVAEPRAKKSAPKEKPPAPVFAAYALGELDPTVVYEEMQALIGSERIAVDEKTRLLTAFLPPGQQTAIQAAIEKMREQIETAPASVSVAYRLHSGGEEQIREQVTAIAPRAVVSVDEDEGQVLITASPEEQDRIAEAFTAMGISEENVEMEVKALQVDAEQATVISEALQTMMPEAQVVGNSQLGTVVVRGSAQDIALAEQVIERWRGAGLDEDTTLHLFPLPRPATDPWLDTVTKVVPRAQVWLDTNTNQLVMLGSEQEKSRLDAMLPQLLTALPDPKPRVLQIYQSEHRSPSELETLLEPVLAALDESGNSNTASPIGSITVDTEGRRLLIMATEEAHEKIDHWVEELGTPRPLDQEKILLVYHLDEARASDVQELIVETLPEATVIADDRRQQLIVTATLAQHGRIKTFIGEVDQPASAATKEEVRAYELDELNASSIVSTLQSMWPQMTLDADAGSNRIIATGTTADHESFRLSIERLNSSATGEDMRVETYRVPVGDLTTLPDVLSQIAPHAIISTDETNRAIVVWAGEEQHKRISTAIEQLTTTAESRRQIEVYQVAPDKANVARLVLTSLFPAANIGADTANGQLTVLADSDVQKKIAEVLEKTSQAEQEGFNLQPQLYETTVETREAFTDVLSTTVPNASLITTGASDPNQLMILASPADHERASALLKKLTDETGPPPEIKPQAYELDRVAPSAFETFLEQRHPTATILSGEGTKRLVIAATEQEQARIAETLDELETVFAQAGQRELRVYPVRKDLSEQAVAGVATEVPEATLLPSNDPERILLLATPTEHTQFDAWLKQLQEQVPAPAPTTSQVYPLEYGDPVGAVKVLETLLPNVVFAADVEGKTVAATATAEDHETILAFIEQYDNRQMDDAQTRVFVLDDADATSLSLAVEQMAPTARVTPDPVGNRLMVTAGKETLDRITEVIENMQSDPSKQRSTKSYQLDEGTTDTLATAIQGSFPRAKISADTTNNRLVISATETEHAEIQELFDSLNSAPPKMTKSYDLESGSARETGMALQSSFPKATITADQTSNNLIVSASEADQTKIAEVIQNMNADGKQVIRNYPLESGNARTTSLALRSSFPKATVSYDSTSNSLIVSASEEDHAKIDEVVQSMNANGNKITKNYPLESGSARTAGLALQSNFPKATISSDSTSNSLIVSASEEDHAKINEVVQSMNADGKKTTKNYPLQSGSARTAGLALQSSFPKASISSDSTSNSLIVSASEEDHAKINEVVQSMNADGKKVTKNYSLQSGSARTAGLALQSSFPAASISSDRTNNNLIVSASEEEQAKIAEVIQSMNADGSRITQNYTLNSGNARTIGSAMQSNFPNATITGDSRSNNLFVSASEEDQTKIADVIQSMNADAKKITKNYPLESGSARSIASAMQSSFPNATISGDRTSNSLVVSASEDEHQMIQAFVQELNTGAKQTTQSYVLENGRPTTLRLALQSTYPQATIGADSANDTLIVSASAEEQKEIAALVQQINEAPARSSDMQAYPLANAKPQSVVDALQQAFGRRSSVGVSADDESGTVFVVGVPQEQEIAKQVIEQMDRIDPKTRNRGLKAFSLAGIDGDEVAQAVQSLFEDARPEVDVRYDFYNEQLVVIATQEQLQLVEETLAQFDPPERELAIFPLLQNDPNSVREAVDTLFADVPTNEVPTVTVDQDRQQLLIRATAEQLDEIRVLLARLGETELAQPSLNGGTSSATSGSPHAGNRARVITVGRNSEALLQQVQQVWPTLRQNPLRVIRPGDSDEQTQGVNPNDAPANDAPADNDPAPKGQPNPGPENFQGAVQPDDPSVRLVAAQDTDSPAAPPAGPEAVPKTGNDNPAILILPKEGQWIIASEDTEALDMLSTLMELAVSPPMTPVAENGNLSVYVLRHGNADELENVLTDLFRQTRQRSRSRLAEETTPTRIVADTRINALVVQSSRATRGVIEDLLAVLDSPEFIDSLQLATPQLIPILHTDAARIEDMLQTVYSSQLSQGRNRPQISIPEGVSQEVASMLEQINAETSGPLLTLSVDEVSNSIVMRAPVELSEEIRSFVNEIDQQAISSRSDRMRIIPLHQSSVDQVEQVLQQFMQRQGSRRGRRR